MYVRDLNSAKINNNKIIIIKLNDKEGIINRLQRLSLEDSGLKFFPDKKSRNEFSFPSRTKH